MGFSIKLNGSRFDDDKVFNSLSLPFLNGLTTEHILGESLLASRKNLANGLNQMTEINSPTWNNDSVSYSTNVANTGLQLEATAGSQNTVIIVAEKNWGSGALFTGGSMRFTGVSAASTCTFQSGAYSGVGNAPAIANADLPSGLICFIGRNNLNSSRISAFNGGTQLSDSGAEGAHSPGVMRLGGDDGTNSNGTFRAAYFAHFNRELSDEEVVQAYLSVKSFLAGRGVAVS